MLLQNKDIPEQGEDNPAHDHLADIHSQILYVIKDGQVISIEQGSSSQELTLHTSCRTEGRQLVAASKPESARTSV